MNHINPIYSSNINTSIPYDAMDCEVKETEELSTILQQEVDPQARALALTESAASLLQQNLLGEKPIDLKLFAHIHGNSYINDTPLEGLSPSTTLSYFIYTLDKLAPITEDSHIQILKKACINCLKNLNASAEEICAKIQVLKEDEFLLLCEGWEGSSGHALLYQITKQKKDRYRFGVFNTGAGIATFHSKIAVGLKWKYNPLLELKNIPASTIASQPFWEAIVLLRKKPFIGDGAHNASDIYNKLLPLLQGEISHLPTDEEHTVTPQLSGICSWKVLPALTKHYCGSHVQKNLMFSIKLWSLVAFFKQQ